MEDHFRRAPPPGDEMTGRRTGLELEEEEELEMECERILHHRKRLAALSVVHPCERSRLPVVGCRAQSTFPRGHSLVAFSVPLMRLLVAESVSMKTVLASLMMVIFNIV